VFFYGHYYTIKFIFLGLAIEHNEAFVHASNLRFNLRYVKSSVKFQMYKGVTQGTMP